MNRNPSIVLLLSLLVLLLVPGAVIATESGNGLAVGTIAEFRIFGGEAAMNKAAESVVLRYAEWPRDEHPV